jgi:hypothetical protein
MTRSAGCFCSDLVFAKVSCAEPVSAVLALALELLEWSLTY